MNIRFQAPSLFSRAMASLIAACVASPLAAQRPAAEWFTPGVWMITVQGGGAAFTDFERGQVTPLADQAGAVPIERRVSAGTATSLGGNVTRWVGAHYGLRAGLSWVPTAFVVRHQAAGAGAAARNDEAEYSGLRIWMADAALVFRPPVTFGRVATYGLIGVSRIRYRPVEGGTLPPEAGAAFARDGGSAWGGVFGIGAAVPLQRRDLLLTFELTNHVTRAPLAGAGGDTVEVNGTPFRLQADDDMDAGSARLSNHLRLMVGVTLPIR